MHPEPIGTAPGWAGATPKGGERESGSAVQESSWALRSLEEITEAALASLDLDELLGILTGRIRDVFAVDTVCVLLLDADRQEFVVRATVGLALGKGLRFPSTGRGVASRILRERRALVIDHLTTEDLANPLLYDRGVRSLAGAPMRLAGRTIGVVHVGSFVPRRFGDEEVALLQLGSDRIALAIEHARLYEEVRRANRARDEMLGVVAHDLGNPLNAIMLSANVMIGRLRRAVAPVAPDPLESILASARRMERLIQDLLDVTKLEAGVLELARARIELTPLIEEAVALARPSAAAASLQIEVEIARDLPAVDADRHRILQVLTNLIGNAVKFTPAEGRVEVRAARAGSDARVEVADTGPGIPVEHLPHVFDRFWRGDRGDRRSAGLGLSIADAIVRKHGGRIGVASIVGAGSRFFFVLPAARGVGTQDAIPCR